MRFLGRSLLGLFLLAATVGLVALGAITLRDALAARSAAAEGGPTARERVYAARVVTVTPGRIAPEIVTFGEVRSRRTLEIRAAVGGTVQALSPAFAEGGRVAAGETLVVIDPTESARALDLARADLAEAEAALADAERAAALARLDAGSAAAQLALRTRALERARDLAQRGVGSAAAIEEAELAEAQAQQAVLARRQALADAEARVAQAAIALERRRIGLAEAERRLAETRILAEFDGVLAEVTAVEGGLVAAGERLGRLIDPAALEVAFRLSTAQHARLVDDAGRLPEASVEVRRDAEGAAITATGRLIREAAAVAEGQTGRLVFAALDTAEGFRPGDFVTVRLTEPPLDGVARIPAAAVDGASRVLALGPDDRLEAVPVRVLRRQGDDVIIAAAALAGREVVAERSPVLGAGIRVRPVREGADAADAAAAPPGGGTIALSPERRARLVALVEAAEGMPPEAKARLIELLGRDEVPVQVVARIEARAGG
jgi:multidrug efflux pump subunit AcrA (membrane-fusion protein)